MLRIFMDNKIPFIRGILENYAEVHYFNPSSTAMGTTDFSSYPECLSELRKADILVVRTRTRCTAGLLEGSDIKCIVTATIGTDHIDLKYCRDHGIKVFRAAGCNSSGVMQYVFTCLYYFAQIKHLDLSNRTLGVVGVGNVGSKVAALGEAAQSDICKQFLKAFPVCELDRTLREAPQNFETIRSNYDYRREICVTL